MNSSLFGDRRRNRKFGENSPIMFSSPRTGCFKLIGCGVGRRSGEQADDTEQRAHNMSLQLIGGACRVCASPGVRLRTRRHLAPLDPVGVITLEARAVAFGRMAWMMDSPMKFYGVLRRSPMSPDGGGEIAMDELERWLTSLGLERHASVLRANDIDPALLSELTEADLAKVGISLGQSPHRSVSRPLAGRQARRHREGSELMDPGRV